MYTDEQLAAWTALKKILGQARLLMEDGIDLGYDRDAAEEEIEQLDSNIDKVEQLFLM